MIDHSNPDNPPLTKSASILFNILNKIPLFSGLSNGSKLALVSICKEHAYQEGEIIFNQNDDSDKMYLIISGYVDIVLKNNQIVATIKPGNLFGEMGIFTSEKRTATALVRTKLLCFSISKNELNSLLLKNAILGRDLLRNVVSLLANKISENNIFIEELSKRLEKLEQ